MLRIAKINSIKIKIKKNLQGGKCSYIFIIHTFEYFPHIDNVCETAQPYYINLTMYVNVQVC